MFRSLDRATACGDPDFLGRASGDDFDPRAGDRELALPVQGGDDARKAHYDDAGLRYGTGIRFPEGESGGKQAERRRMGICQGTGFPGGIPGKTGCASPVPGASSIS